MHGFTHVEIPTRDLKRAKNFYGKVFGWTFQEMPNSRRSARPAARS